MIMTMGNGNQQKVCIPIKVFKETKDGRILTTISVDCFHNMQFCVCECAPAMFALLH